MLRLFPIAAAAMLSGCTVLFPWWAESWAEIQAERALWAELGCDSYGPAS